MSNPSIDQLLSELKQNAFVDSDELAVIEQQFAEGTLTAERAEHKPNALKTRSRLRPLGLPKDPSADEWDQLASVVRQSELSALHWAKLRYVIAVISVPIVAVATIASLLLEWQSTPAAPVIIGVFSATILAVMAYSFMLLRLQQQASLAAERLAEKRVGLMFMRLAMNEESVDRSNVLLDAGTSMFLGHHAPATLPLTSEDLAAVRKVAQG